MYSNQILSIIIGGNNHHHCNGVGSSSSGGGGSGGTLINSYSYMFNILIFLALIITPINSLKCYICHTNDNNQCELQDCPADQAYDRCMTTLYKNPNDGRNIKKECALAPCHLRGLKHLNFANFKSNCESSKQDDCVFCCTQDGCNKDLAFNIKSNFNLILLLLILSLCLISFYYF